MTGAQTAQPLDRNGEQQRPDAQCEPHLHQRQRLIDRGKQGEILQAGCQARAGRGGNKQEGTAARSELFDGRMNSLMKSGRQRQPLQPAGDLAARPIPEQGGQAHDDGARNQHAADEQHTGKPNAGEWRHHQGQHQQAGDVEQPAEQGGAGADGQAHLQPTSQQDHQCRVATRAGQEQADPPAAERDGEQRPKSPVRAGQQQAIAPGPAQDEAESGGGGSQHEWWRDVGHCFSQIGRPDGAQDQRQHDHGDHRGPGDPKQAPPHRRQRAQHWILAARAA